MKMTAHLQAHNEREIVESDIQRFGWFHFRDDSKGGSTIMVSKKNCTLQKCQCSELPLEVKFGRTRVPSPVVSPCAVEWRFSPV